MNSAEPEKKIRRRWFGIFPRALLLSTTGVVLALGAFATTIVKREQRVLLENVEKKAALLAASVDRVTAEAIFLEDSYTVLEQCEKMVGALPEVLYTVVTKQSDGASLVFTKEGWRAETRNDSFWCPERAEANSEIINSALVTAEVLHFRYPFAYEGQEWGWIHVGMSLDEYYAGLESIYRIVILLAVPGLIIGMVLSFFFARRLTRPIWKLRQFARKVSSGDLDHRVEVRSNDELGELADSMNQMTSDLARSIKQEAELREKDVLLKEIHHRVKNNMQILTSLLRLQSRKVAEESMQAILRESENRIRSMGLIHEKLYQSNSVSQIDFGSYANTLSGELRRMYVGSNPSVSVTVDVDDVQLGLDTALPCGLILNELVSNSLKYAFPDGREGKVTIRMKALGEGRFELDVSDDGVGVPPGQNLEREGSLGMRLVDMLVEQLNGEMQCHHESGVTTTIQFSETQYKQRV